MIPITYYVFLSALLFSIGGVGFLWNRNVLITLMSIEVMLNAVNLALVAFNRIHTLTVDAAPAHTGQLFAFFLIADIDSSRGGMIRVKPQNLLSLADSLR